MAIHLTRIYTKTGDAGSTGLGDFSRVPKTHPRIAAYADVDETNCALGVAVALGELPQHVLAVLAATQNDLFDVGADLCVPERDSASEKQTPGGAASETIDATAPPAPAPLRVTAAQITRLEQWCDEFNEPLAALTSFILPGGTPGAALLHSARAVARRAERSVWALIETEPETGHAPAIYLNRLSDLLFILARAANPGGDVLWQPGGGPADAVESVYGILGRGGNTDELINEIRGPAELP
ncbi:MAG: cob(I)yrinic acid a,c-diamide adenosyltransferase [Mycobacteriales bacterium]